MTRPPDHEPESDPYFQATDIGPAKAAPAAGGRARRSYQKRMAVLGIALAAVWVWVLADPRLGPMVLLGLSAFGAVLGVFVGAMGLGLVGFGLCAAGDRFVGWLRRGARWPEE